MVAVTEIYTNIDDVTMKVKSSTNLTLEGVYLALHYLDCNRVIHVDRPNNNTDYANTLVKFGAINQKVTPISEIERSIYNLEQTETNLTKNIVELENKISEEDLKIREMIRNGRKNLAKIGLRKKKHLEKDLEQKIYSLENVQTLRNRINNIKHDKSIIQALKLGTTTLKTILSDSGITLENVDDVLADVRETAQMYDDIQSIVGESTNNSDATEDELENELEELMANFEQNPPTHEPIIDSGKSETRNEPENVDFDSSILKRLDALKMDFVNLSTDDKTMHVSQNENK